MKILILLTFILGQIFLVGCENIPRGRTSIAELESKITSDDEEVPEDIDLSVERPSGAIVVQSDFCGCSQGEPITFGNCEAVCDSKPNDENQTLYFNVELTNEITLDETFGNVFGWCNAQLPVENGDAIVGTGCVLEIKDETGSTQAIAFEPDDNNSTSFSVDIGGLNDNTTYRVTIVEQTSGATSTTFQFRKFSDLLESRKRGPLQIEPVNRYTCMIREFETTEGSGSTNLLDLDRFHLFFNSQTRPEPLREETVASFFCHDIGTYGETPINSPLLEETTGVFSVWYKDDPRFYNLFGGPERDINELIEQEVNLQGSTLSATPDLFAELNWLSYLDDGDATPGGDNDVTSVQVRNENLGFYMSPFLDSDTFKAYCPTRAHYFSNSPLFKAMKEYIGVDTEGLYIAKENNVCNFLLVNESVVEKIWFYKQGGNHIKPTSDTIAGKQIQFYWPADPSSPYIKKSHQRIYTIKATDELSDACGTPVSSTSTNTSGGIPDNFPPHDKRIGCVPVLAD